MAIPIRPGRLLQESSSAFRNAFAAQLGCTPAAFDAPGLTIAERPADSREPDLAIMAECGIGSVVSVKDARLAEWATHQELEAHFRIFLPSFVEGMAERARELAYASAVSRSPAMGMVLALVLPLPGIPPGLSLVEIGRDRQEQLRVTGEFDNALGELDEDAKIERFRTAFALVAEGDTVAGVAGIWEQYPGIDEIGVDVARGYRGQGLAKVLTLAATRDVRRRGAWPIYTCGVANLRSQNNGLTCGYRPLWLVSVVRERNP